jgi:hypothetical protein
MNKNNKKEKKKNDMNFNPSVPDSMHCTDIQFLTSHRSYFSPINQLISFVFKFDLFSPLFVGGGGTMCYFQFNLQLKCSATGFCALTSRERVSEQVDCKLKPLYLGQWLQIKPQPH